MNLLHQSLVFAVARFNANANRVNLNCNANPRNSKSFKDKKDESSRLEITQILKHFKMKTYKNIYKELYSKENILLAYKKATKGKSSRPDIKEFKKYLFKNLESLHQELKNQTYKPKPLKKFIIRDPKTRTIHKSDFKDRIIHHTLINILEPIYEKTFIHDSFANRKNKGTHKAIQRFDKFKRKVSKNGKLTNNPYNNNSVQGYLLKADIKHYFKTVDHSILLKILKRKIKDKKVIQLTNKILKNYGDIGMPLGNLTSQFFANLYLNELDYFIKHKLKIKFYIRYVDDFVILHPNKNILKEYQEAINSFLNNKLRLKLHPDKSKIQPLKNGTIFLGYKIFYHYKLLRKSNLRTFKERFNQNLRLCQNKSITFKKLIDSIIGWLGYSIHANTYFLRRQIISIINTISFLLIFSVKNTQFSTQILK